MDIAVIGTGFAGLTSGLLLLKQGHRVTFFDSNGIGGGASGIAAGLMHPFVGANAAKSWKAEEALEASLAMLRLTSSEAGKPLFRQTGLKRFPLNQKQEDKFKQCASKFPEAMWVEGHPSYLWIEQAYQVNCPLYLQTLWQLCQNLGAKLELKEVKTLEELTCFDQIVVAAGGGASDLIDLPLRRIKGQALTLSPSSSPPPACALNSSAYIFFDPDKALFHAGATYEKDFKHLNPDPEFAIPLIKEKILPFYPEIETMEVTDVKAGLRVFTKEKIRPKVERVSKNVIVFCGLGSRGLLHHALCAQEVVNHLKLIQTS